MICACGFFFPFLSVLRPFHCLSFPRCRLRKRWTRLIWRTILSHTPSLWSPDPWETCLSFLPMTSRSFTPPGNVERLCRLCLKRGRRWQGDTLLKGINCSGFDYLQGWSPGFLSVNAWKSKYKPEWKYVCLKSHYRLCDLKIVFILLTVRWTLTWGTVWEVTRKTGRLWTESEFPCGICQLAFIFKFFAAGMSRLKNYCPGYWFHVSWLLVAQLSWTDALCLAEMMLCGLKIRSQMSKPLGAFLKS